MRLETITAVTILTTLGNQLPQRCTAWTPTSLVQRTPSWQSLSGTPYSHVRQRNRVASSSILFSRGRAPPAEEGMEQKKSFFNFPGFGETEEMPDQVEHLLTTSTSEQGQSTNPLAVGGIAVAGVAALAAIAINTNIVDSSTLETIQEAIQNPSAALDQVVTTVESMGPLGALYFGIAYTIAEILAIPAIPLTASAGYLFGPVEGTTVVLFSAATAAAISFVIGRTLLRDYVEGKLVDYPQFAKIDRAIGKEGFKLMLLLRLSPIFPFALSNYLYGASSINFPAFFWGTLLGFAPGTIAYVCTGAFGKALSDGGDSTYPWYLYAGGLALLSGFLKVAADTATRIVEEMEEEEDII